MCARPVARSTQKSAPKERESCRFAAGASLGDQELLRNLLEKRRNNLNQQVTDKQDKTKLIRSKKSTAHISSGIGFMMRKYCANNL